MSLDLLCTSYPELNDVWTNHVLSFLIPTRVQVRKRRSLVCFEIVNFQRGEFVDTFWLTDSIARITLQRCGVCLLHVLDDGSIHCLEQIQNPYNRWFSDDHGGAQSYYGQTESRKYLPNWEEVDNVSDWSAQTICMHRYLVLQDIRQVI
jgi:hypothetical protein